MIKVMLSLALVGAIAHADAKKEPPCAQIDLREKYDDGVPFCPEVVKDNAFAVTRCAFSQAREWHAATDKEKATMSQLVSSFKAANVAGVMTNADALKLQVCRSQKDNDSFLLLYTKPGVRDYSGPFLMLREGGKTSNLVLHAPHDGQDGTNRSTRDAFQNSNALALISNGHSRTLSGRIPSKHGETNPFPSDWAHTKADLGYQAFFAFKNQFPESVHVHIHGLAANRVMVTDSVGWNAPHTLRGAFIDAVSKALKGREGFPVVAWHFNGWATGLSMTQNEDGKGRAANQRWVGTEFSVRLHANTNVLTKAIINLETDYLKKPRPVTVDLDKDVVPLAEDVVDLKELEDDKVPEEALVAPVVTLMAAAPVAEGYKYAKIPKGNVGIKKLACVGISYSNPINDYVTAQVCQKTANNTAEFFSFNSRGMLKLQAKGYHMDYNGDGWKTFGAAEQVAKRSFSANYYIIPSIFRKGGNHASGGIAHVIQLTGWVVNHEVGHLLGLGHTGRYVYNKDGKPSLEPYNDKDSVMSNVGSKFLTAPQYFHLGWLRSKEVASYEAGKTYELTQITQLPNTKTDGPLFMVQINPDQFAKDKRPKAGVKTRDAFVSFPKRCNDCAALHLRNGGGSQLVASFKDEYYDENFTGLHYKVIEAGKGKVKVVIDDALKPAGFMARELAADLPDDSEGPVDCEGDDDGIVTDDSKPAVK